MLNLIAAELLIQPLNQSVVFLKERDVIHHSQSPTMLNTVRIFFKYVKAKHKTKNQYEGIKRNCFVCGTYFATITGFFCSYCCTLAESWKTMVQKCTFMEGAASGTFLKGTVFCMRCVAEPRYASATLSTATPRNTQYRPHCQHFKNLKSHTAFSHF